MDGVHYRMTNFAQQAMDGSPARVLITPRDLLRAGKFRNPMGLLELQQGAADLPAIDIKFQCGPIKVVGVNGCAIEDVIDVLMTRLDGFQRGPFACDENAHAIGDLAAAKAALEARTAKRQIQGVEGTNQAHTA